MDPPSSLPGQGHRPPDGSEGPGCAGPGDGQVTAVGARRVGAGHDPGLGTIQKGTFYEDYTNSLLVTSLGSTPE